MSVICNAIECKKASEEWKGHRAHSYVVHEGELGVLLLENNLESGCRFINLLFQFLERVL